MESKQDTDQGPSTYIHADPVTCIALMALLLAGSVLVLGISTVAAPWVNALWIKVGPQPTPTISRAAAGTNLALYKSVRVSRQIADFPASAAVDGNLKDWWGSGAHAPQWIEVDLGAQYVISEVRLLPSQSPPGQTIHRILAKGTATGGRYVLIHTFDGFTTDNSWLTYAPAEPARGVRYIRIETVSSPSWVSWREIVVTAGE